jgi:hypothetical protein
VDVYYSYNFNRPNSLSNQGSIRARLYDAKANQFQVSNVEFFIQKPATPAGFRLDIAFGPTASLMHDHENTGCVIIGPCVADINASQGKYTFQNIMQAYISWDAPLGRGLLIDVGKFDSPVMLEMTPSNMNWNYSHSFIYTFAIPMFDVGLRAGYPVTDTLAIHGYFVNGWDNDTEYCTSSPGCFQDPNFGTAANASKTFGTRIAWNPFPSLMFNAAWMGGVEGTNGGNAWRNLWEANATYVATNKLAFMIDYVYGDEPYGVVGQPTPPVSPLGGPHYRWSGVAGYARYAVNNWLAFSPRIEWFRDVGGLRTGAVHHQIGTTKGLYEVTWTNEVKITRDLIVRLEYRRDMLINATQPDPNFGSQNVFEDSDGKFSKGHQDTMLVGVMYTF